MRQQKTREGSLMGAGNVFLLARTRRSSGSTRKRSSVN